MVVVVDIPRMNSDEYSGNDFIIIRGKCCKNQKREVVKQITEIKKHPYGHEEKLKNMSFNGKILPHSPAGCTGNQV
jgi:hypothetical protein